MSGPEDVPNFNIDLIVLVAEVLIGLVVTTFAVIIGVVTWIEHGRPRRFSLRTLLISTALIAIVLGLIIYGGRK
jgi:hypothetical protein